MKALGEQIARLAESDYSVVVKGETGTGKSRVAELLHRMSDRKARHLFTVDCRSRSAEQLETELFGRLPGRGRPSASRDGGVLSEINGGTLVLDAPELLPLPMQERVLSLLEKRTYLPAGGIVPLPCNVRMVALTSVDLEKEAAEGRFSRNLLMRLSDAVLNLPPLRERREDIPAICRLFLVRAADDLGRACPEISPDAMTLLQAKPWPGNFRELKQLLRRAVFHAGAIVTTNDVRLDNMEGNDLKEGNHIPRQSLKLTDLEEWAIRKALQKTEGKKMQAAELLGISYNAFKDKLKRYGIS